MGNFRELLTEPFASVTAIRARAMLDDGAMLVDVRTSQEWNAGHAPHARHIPLDTLDRHAGSLASGTTVVTICKSGMRSAQAKRMLAPQGLTVASVTGAMFAWQRSGGRVVAKNGRDGTVA